MIFVTGAKGMLGSYLKKVFDEKELYLTDCRVNSALPECLLSATTLEQSKLCHYIGAE